jgi:RNA polymerase sigma-70 factor (ECF subfamily)
MMNNPGLVSTERPQAFDDQMLEEIGDLRRLSIRLASSRAEADDLVQDAFVHALRAHDRYQPGTNLKAWLSTILRNLASNRRRDQFRSRVRIDEASVSRAADVRVAAQQGPEQVLLSQVVGPTLQSALESMPKTLRDAVWLRDVEDMSYAEIAARLRIPVGTVMSRISRGRRLLHDRLVASADRTAL